MNTEAFKIGVIGAGTMGNGIAHVFSLYNFKVLLVDINDKIIDSALKNIKHNMERQLKKNIIDTNQMSNALSNIETSNNLKDMSNCSLIIEAIKEDFNIKSNIFKQLDQVCDKKTILCSNTSSISINKLAECTSRQDKIIGMHFMNPVPIMKLVEVINGKNTSKDTSQSIIEIAKVINKIPIQCNDSPGFVSNRILMPMINEAVHCYSENVGTVESIDLIMKLGMGHPMGPLMLADLIGIDVCVNILEVLQEDLEDIKYKPNNLLIQMIEKGHLGKKTGKGFYNHEL